jgi:hypothetical protein
MKNLLLTLACALLPAAVFAGDNKITAVPLFQSCGIYFEAADMSVTPVTEFKEKGSQKWLRALELAAIPEKTVEDSDVSKAEARPYTDKAMFRGSIVSLKEDTVYELRIRQADKSFSAEFKTWSSNVPVKKTVNVKNLKFDRELVITEKGSADGWIKFTADKDFVLKGDDRKNAVITVRGGEYVILENLKVDGGGRHGVSLENSQNIRVVNCDISGFGRIGNQDVKKDGKYYDNDGHAINNDAGVNIAKSGNVVVERCYIHDPRGHANSWKYSHPAGPNAVAVLSTGGTVLRYNDFIGSDLHRWNDAVEGHANGSPRGGFFRDAEIYGNMFIYANDDGIELDGGQMNIRVFQNKFEGSLCGVSTGPCLLGPSYIFKNLIVNLADEEGLSYSAFKNGHGLFDRGISYFFNNTVLARGGYGHYNNNKDGLAAHGSELRGVTRNNILHCSRDLFSGSVFKRGNDFDYDLIYSDNPGLLKTAEDSLKAKGWEKHGIFGKEPKFLSPQSGIFTLVNGSPAEGVAITVDNFLEQSGSATLDMGAFQRGETMPLPYRPAPFYLDVYQVNLSAGNGEAPSSAIVNATVDNTVGGAMRFKIAKNSAFDWFSVSPSAGDIKGGHGVFTVSLNMEKIKKPGLLRGIFLVRLESGLSRPVTVYAKISGREEIKKPGPGFAAWLEAEKPASMEKLKIIGDRDASDGKCVYLDPKEKDTRLSYDFNLPSDGDYFIFARVKSEEPVGAHDSMFMSIDGGDRRVVSLRSDTDWRWSGCGTADSLGTTAKPVPLTKGPHNITIYPREPVFVDMLLVTDNYRLVY